MTGPQNDALRSAIEQISNGDDKTDAKRVIRQLLDGLEEGAVRAATRQEDGVWSVNEWVKRGILAAFRAGSLTFYESGALSFVDLDTLPPRRFDQASRVRVVPGGSSVRRGAHIGRGTICMPPSYVNVGAFVGADSMVDSHALVGSCAQIGDRVHLSAAVQIGGVLEPPGALPVIVEDDAFVGGGCGVYEGCIVRRAAVLAPGVIISRATPVYDLVNERVLRGTREAPLEIPPGAVVVPGSRPAEIPFARAQGISVYTPVIVKYRDERTDASTALEHALREHL